MSIYLYNWVECPNAPHRGPEESYEEPARCLLCGTFSHRLKLSTQAQAPPEKQREEVS